MDATRLRFLSFWAINDELDLDLLTFQLNEFKRLGLNGVVFHPRFYPNRPAYMSKDYLNIVSTTILHAKSIGLSFWIYDENGWPSGTAGGAVLAGCPGLTCEWMEWSEGTDGGGEIAFRSKNAVSSLDQEATHAFIRFTHEGYKHGLHPEAFDYVTGFFTDEVGFLDGHSVSVMNGAVPWNRRLPEMYRVRYNEELEPLLPFLFQESKQGNQLKVRYWELVTDLLIEGFYKPIEDWCEANGKLFAGHLKGEENPFFQLSYSGSCFHVLKGMSMPAIDALERYPGNDFYPRIIHSLSVQQGRESCMVEAHGGSGWGASPESFSNYIEWLASHGIEQFVFHLSQYRLNSHAVHDWPPSMPLHLTWKEAFPAVLGSIRERCTKLPSLREQEPDLLIITPTRGVMAAFLPADAMVINEHNGANVPDSVSGRISNAFIDLVQECHSAGVHYELTEERTLEEIGIVNNGQVTIGKRSYNRVLVADGCEWLTGTSGNVVDRMRAEGVDILTPETWRSRLQKRDSQKAERETTTYVPKQLPWQAYSPETNRIALHFRENTNGKLVARVGVGCVLKKTLTLVLFDRARSVSFNGKRMDSVIRTDEGHFRYHIPEELFIASDEIEIELDVFEDAEPNPVAFIEGEFAVASLSPFLDHDGRQWSTKGPFQLKDMKTPQPQDLVFSGFPFCDQAITLEKTFSLDNEISDAVLHLGMVSGDAAFVCIDNAELGWIWGTDWQCHLPIILNPGDHVLTIKLIPSTYNVFGPHRHLDGDRHLVSPDQYKGIKNFADIPHAPLCTEVEEWHFVKWGIQGKISFLVSR